MISSGFDAALRKHAQQADEVTEGLRSDTIATNRTAGSPRIRFCNQFSVRNTLIAMSQLIASLTGFPTRLSISTSVSIVNLAVFLFTTSDTRGRETIRISAAWACFR